MLTSQNNTQDLFYKANKKRAFSDVLNEVQAYISSKYSALVIDGINKVNSGDDNVKQQVKRYIGKYLLDYKIAVDGLTQNELIDKLYTEMAEFLILSISLDTIYTKNFSKFSLLPHKYPRSVSGVDICAGASCGGTQCCMITPPFFSRRHAAYCRADSPIVPITHKVTPNKRF